MGDLDRYHPADEGVLPGEHRAHPAVAHHLAHAVDADRAARLRVVGDVDEGALVRLAPLDDGFGLAREQN